jgi:hypothetical protein
MDDLEALVEAIVGTVDTEVEPVSEGYTTISPSSYKISTGFRKL